MTDTRREPRTARLGIPLRPEELSLIESEAFKADLPASAWARDVLIKEAKLRQQRRLRSEGRQERSSYSLPAQPREIAAAPADMQERIRAIVAREIEESK